MSKPKDVVLVNLSIDDNDVGESFTFHQWFPNRDAVRSFLSDIGNRLESYDLEPDEDEEDEEKEAGA